MSSHFVELFDGYEESRPDDREAVQSLLDDLGLVYTLEVDTSYLKVAVGLNKKDLTRWTQLQNHPQAYTATDFGRLFGYPETAVQAFANGQSMPQEQQALLQAQAGLPRDLFLFRMSNTHAEVELHTLLRWVEWLREYDLLHWQLTLTE